MGIPEWEEERPSVEEGRATLMAFDWETTPTPTIQEFVYSYDPRRWNPRTIEDLLYWDIKGAILVGPYASKMAFMLARGVPFAEAGYLASQRSFGAYRFISKLNRFRYLVHPAMAPVAVTVAVAGGYGMTSDVHHGAIPGVTEFGGMGPGYYGSDPMGQFRKGVEGLAFWR